MNSPRIFPEPVVRFAFHERETAVAAAESGFHHTHHIHIPVNLRSHEKFCLSESSALSIFLGFVGIFHDTAIARS